MKKNIITLLLVITLINGCAMEQIKNKSPEKTNETTDFYQFSSLFDDIELPMTLDESYLTYKFLTQKDTIEWDLVNLYIGENMEIMYEEFGYVPYKFYPIGKFSISSSIIGLVYAKDGVAGGVEAYLILSLYSVNGEKTDELIVGKDIAEGEGYSSWITSKINQNKISSIETTIEEDYDEEGELIYQKESKEEKQYNIDTICGKIKLMEKEIKDE